MRSRNSGADSRDDGVYRCHSQFRHLLSFTPVASFADRVFSMGYWTNGWRALESGQHRRDQLQDPMHGFGKGLFDLMHTDDLFGTASGRSVGHDGN